MVTQRVKQLSPDHVEVNGEQSAGTRKRVFLSTEAEKVHGSDVKPKPVFQFPPIEDLRESRRDITRFLKNHFVHQLMPMSGTSVIFDSELTISDAFHSLQEQQLVAAPIWDSASRRLIGMLTVTTFIEVLLHYSNDKNIIAVDLGSQTIKQWLETIGRSKEALITLDPDATLYTACDQLQKFRLHRLPIVEERSDDQCVLFIIEHLKILRFLLMQLETQPSILNYSLGELQIGTCLPEKIFTCQMHTPLAVVLRLQHQRNITAIPVVDSDGRVLDLLCRSDTLHIAREGLYRDLNITVGQTLEIRQMALATKFPRAR